ncbi:MAG: hypothetical protein H8E32_09400 [Nitrospinae bacterium]|nr:hypothetical protein [Nitrospinota bacterium]
MVNTHKAMLGDLAFYKSLKLKDKKMSKTTKIVLTVLAVLMVTLFYLMWTSLGGGPTIAPRSSL